MKEQGKQKLSEAHSRRCDMTVNEYLSSVNRLNGMIKEKLDALGGKA